MFSDRAIALSEYPRVKTGYAVLPSAECISGFCVQREREEDQRENDICEHIGNHDEHIGNQREHYGKQRDAIISLKREGVNCAKLHRAHENDERVPGVYRDTPV